MGGTLSIQASYGKRHFPHFRPPPDSSITEETEHNSNLQEPVAVAQ
jgi:hypothetical protein